jgi:hypothetical protein
MLRAALAQMTAPSPLEPSVGAPGSSWKRYPDE